MTTIQFLAEWALRSAILILSGALLLRALRVRDSSIRLAAWTAMLCGSLAIPALTPVLPGVPLAVMRTAARPAPAPLIYTTALEAVQTESRSGVAVKNQRPTGSTHFDWARAAVIMYFLVALAFLLRASVGLAISLRLLRNSRATGRTTDGIEILESDRVVAPVTLGIVHPAIVLPLGWRQWESARLNAVLAHERSHIRRHDPAVQLLSAIHRALLWHSPLSWFLHQRIVRIAEEASDDAAVAVTQDRASYAEVLLDFMRLGTRKSNWQGVPMARYGRADDRIHRILEETVLSRGVTRRSLVAILILGSPLAYVAAAAYPQHAAQAAAPAQSERNVPQIPAPGGPPTAERPSAPDALPVKPSVQYERKEFVEQFWLRRDPTTSVLQVMATGPEPAPVYLMGLGNVAAATVAVKPRVDGPLMSVNFREGQPVQAGQVVASVDPTPYDIGFARAKDQLVRDQKQLDAVLDRYKAGLESITVRQFAEAAVKVDQAKVEDAQLRLAYTQITAPMSGVAGLRLVEPGNFVRAADSTILTINQVQPISVLFTIPERLLPEVRALLNTGANPPAEAWNAENTVKIATGRLTAADNQIDAATGTAKLKAVFENKDGALFPNQFVNVRLLISTR